MISCWSVSVLNIHSIKNRHGSRQQKLPQRFEWLLTWNMTWSGYTNTTLKTRVIAATNAAIQTDTGGYSSVPPEGINWKIIRWKMLLQGGSFNKSFIVKLTLFLESLTCIYWYHLSQMELRKKGHLHQLIVRLQTPLLHWWNTMIIFRYLTKWT